jgi:hypothetical protein
MIEFVQRPGETVWVPGGWWHAVLNLDDTIAITQNVCTSAGFPRVWAEAIRNRRGMARKWLRTLRLERPALAAIAEAHNISAGVSLVAQAKHHRQRRAEQAARRAARRARRNASTAKASEESASDSETTSSNTSSSSGSLTSSSSSSASAVTDRPNNMSVNCARTRAQKGVALVHSPGSGAASSGDETEVTFQAYAARRRQHRRVQTSPLQEVGGAPFAKVQAVEGSRRKK